MNKTKPDDQYKLLITHELVSKSKKFYGLFKPKDMIVSQPCHIYFKIKNISDNDFPGGRISALRIGSGQDKGTLKATHGMSIPKILPGETYILLPLKIVLAYEGTMWCLLTIDAMGGGKIIYYQWDKINNKAELIDEYYWTDFFHVASLQEIHQRYTNYLLLFLTGMTLVLFFVNILLLILR